MGVALSKAQIGRIMDAFSERGEKVCEVRYLPNGELRFLTETLIEAPLSDDPIEAEIAALKARHGQG